MYTGLTDSTSGEPSASYSRRIVNDAGRTMNTLSVLNSAMSYWKRSWKRSVLSNSAERNPSCIRISSTANAMPATATSRRSGLCHSCSHPSGTVGEKPRSMSAADFDFDLEIGQVRDRRAVVELDLHLHDAPVLPC